MKPKSSRRRRAYTLLILSLIVLVLVTISVIIISQTGLNDITSQISKLLNPATPSIATNTDLFPTQTPTNNTIALKIAIQPSATAKNTNIAIPQAASNPNTARKITDLSVGNGFLILSFYEGINAHLFAYHPQNLSLSRLTAQAWDDINPACSPDGKKLAYASNRNGYWDLYIMDLTNGQTQQVTNTPMYDGSPSWSPDGHWLVYESYIKEEIGPGGNLELMILDISQENMSAVEPIRLTTTKAAELSPSWSPNGRMIAYVAIDNGEKDIWLANLDNLDDRFRNLTKRSSYAAQYPAWSPDGQTLLWSASIDGISNLYQWKPAEPQLAPKYMAVGEQTAWDTSSNVIFTTFQTPNQTYMTAFNASDGTLQLTPMQLEGKANGLCWSSTTIPDPLPSFMQQAINQTPPSVWNAAMVPQSDISFSRQQVISLANVNAPFAMLHDLIDEAFQALRTATYERIGWDFLGKLENAFVPLTSPLNPGILEDWLYTGRAFTASSAPLGAQWMVVVREDHGAATYWRIYLRTNYQDGSQGMPLRDLPWDFEKRLVGDPRNYEQGGNPMKIPPEGYWCEFTQLASSFGWERLPALSSWRMAPETARFTEFLHGDGLSWYEAMLELYPAEALFTVTPLPPPTLTPTKTPFPSRTPTPTITVVLPTPTPSITIQAGTIPTGTP